MKKLSLLVILLICRLVAGAQETGYYVKNNNDTVRCLIKLNDALEPTYRYYNAKHKSRMRRLSPDSVKAFKLSDKSSYYIARSVPTTYNNKKQELVFLKHLKYGRINLYRFETQYYDASSGREEYYNSLYASKGTDSLKVLMTGDMWPLKQTQYRNLFYSLISDEPGIADEYMARDGKHSLFYNYNTIEDFISRYNKAAAAKSD